ncbi:hypothetical protein YTPLAS18_29520 [Nitrospira sp.]|nr:hypothetical protein YTPLAS18_29520 [Nitrospira sp.]
MNLSFYEGSVAMKIGTLGFNLMRHLREHRPKMMAELEASGELLRHQIYPPRE